MVKPIFVPSATASRAEDGVNQPSKMSGNGSKVANNATTERESKAKNAPTTIDFDDVFTELQKYKQENNGSLSIPVSHPALSRIIDSLSELSSEGMESLSKKRWDDQMAVLKKFKENQGDINVPLSHPTLGNWVRIQREHYKLREQKMPNALTKKRFGKLKAIGFGDGGNGEKSEESGKTDGNSSQNERKRVKHEETASQNDVNDNDKDAAPDRNKRKAMNGFGDGGNGEKSEGLGKNDSKSSQNETKKVKHEETASQNDGNNNDKDADPDRNKRKAMKPKEEHSEEGNDESSMSPVHDAATASNGSKVTQIKGKCDICEKNDGFWGHNLQQCKECHVLVHELCYGMPETKCKNPNFVCHACKAVGTEVEVNVPSKIGGCKKMGEKRELVRQEQRPTMCVLCSHDKGFHAMHPLLDTHGSDGRQLVIDRSCWEDGLAKKKKVLAWVHTLCANVICSNPRTLASVYGCGKDGNYFDDGEDSGDEEEFIDEKKGSAKEDDDEAKLANHSDEEESSKGEEICANEAICSFAIATEAGYAKNIKDHRNLKCFVCGKIDKTWRIPVQCSAGDKDEPDRWKGRHREGTECYVAVHVGCARWGCVEPEGEHLEKIDGNRCRLSYFTPGRDVVDDEASKDSYDREKSKTVAHCYCRAHARDIVLHNPRNKRPSVVTSSSATSNVGRSSSAGKAKSEQPRRKSAIEPNRESRAHPQKKSAEHAQSSFKKSLNSMRRRGGNKKISLKRKSGAVDSSDGVFGAGSKKAKIEFAEENAVQFPIRGKSASALAVPLDHQWQSSGQMNPSAASANNRNNVQAASILKKKEPGASSSSSMQLSGKRKPGQVQDLPTSAAAPVPNPNPSGVIVGILKRRDPAVLDDSSGRVSGKRKTGPVPDLPTGGGSFKRMKTED